MGGVFMFRCCVVNFVMFWFWVGEWVIDGFFWLWMGGVGVEFKSGWVCDFVVVVDRYCVGVGVGVYFFYW